jgi:hypothetical protein
VAVGEQVEAQRWALRELAVMAAEVRVAQALTAQTELLIQVAAAVVDKAQAEALAVLVL